MIVTDVGMRCGGRGSVGRASVVAGRVFGPVSIQPARQTNGAKARRSLLAETGCCVRQNRVVLAPVAGVKLSGGEVNSTELDQPGSANDGDKTNSSPRRARHKP